MIKASRLAPGLVYSLIDVLLIMVQRSLVCLLVMTGFNPKELCISWSTRTSICHFWMSVFQRLTRTAYYIVKSVRRSVAYWLNGAAEPRMAVIHEAAFFEVQPQSTYSNASTSTVASVTTSPLCLPMSRRSSSFGQTLTNVLNRDFDLELFDQSLFYERDPTLEDVDCALLDETDLTLELALLGRLNDGELFDFEASDGTTASYHSDSDTCTTSSCSLSDIV
uniref:TORC_C domain-containing protein n=1 Tax=Panagrellus redivivus TaxID=6233 RepID=A0A7E4UR69_PANRE